MQKYGRKNEDERYRFKIDNRFPVNTIPNAETNPIALLPINETEYLEGGTEFIIIKRGELEGAQADYAVRADKYKAIREALNQARDRDEKYSVDDLIKSGGLKVNEDLSIEEIVRLSDGRDITKLREYEVNRLTWNDIEYVHHGWLEHTVGKDGASDEEYLAGAKLLIKYVHKAVDKGIFPGGDGMAFNVRTNNDSYEVRPWCVIYSEVGSGAIGGGDFSYLGCFLKIA